MDFDKLARINLIKGAGGGDPKAGLCIMEMVSYFDGADRVTDRPKCACPVLTEWAIRLNDSAPTQADRDGLKPLLPLLSGSRDDDARQKRAEHIVREVTHRIVAPLFDKRWPKHAKALRAAQTTAEIKTANAAAAADANAANAAAAADADANAADAPTAAAATAAYAAANAAAAAAYAATANAAAAAYAATANANAAAYAATANANAATAAANANADAAADAAAANAIWQIRRAILVEAIHLGAHGGLDLDAPATEARADQLLAVLA